MMLKLLNSNKNKQKSKRQKINKLKKMKWRKRKLLRRLPKMLPKLKHHLVQQKLLQWLLPQHLHLQSRRELLNLQRLQLRQLHQFKLLQLLKLLLQLLQLKLQSYRNQKLLQMKSWTKVSKLLISKGQCPMSKGPSKKLRKPKSSEIKLLLLKIRHSKLRKKPKRQGMMLLKLRRRLKKAKRSEVCSQLQV